MNKISRKFGGFSLPLTTPFHSFCGRPSTGDSYVRTVVLSALMLVFSACPAFAQEWAKKMFSSTEIDFGKAVHNVKTEHRFQITNLFVEDVHITSVSTTCNCTTPMLVKKGTNEPVEGGLTLKTYETGELLARFNTHQKVGPQQATLSVHIDRPMPAVVQVNVRGNIITDITVNPSYIDMGPVAYGQTKEQTVSITRSGPVNWNILDVQSVNQNFEVEKPVKRNTLNSVTFDMKVKLKSTAPIGSFNDQLVVITNDNNTKKFPIQVIGEVKGEISVTPSLWMAGALNPGDTAKRLLIVRNNAEKPFKILNIISEDDAISFKPISADAPAKAVHTIPITLTAGTNPGRQLQNLKIQTDLGNGVEPKVEVHYLVKGNLIEKKPEQNITGKSEKSSKTELNLAKPIVTTGPGSVLLNTTAPEVNDGVIQTKKAATVSAPSNNIEIPVIKVDKTNDSSATTKPAAGETPRSSQNPQQPSRRIFGRGRAGGVY